MHLPHSYQCSISLTSNPHLFLIMSPNPEATQAGQPAPRSPSPEETPDIIPSHVLSGEEAEEDYQKQLALLAEQEAAYQAQKAGRSPSPEETADIMPDRILSPEEAEADYQKQLALLRQQNAEYDKNQGSTEEDAKSRL